MTSPARGILDLVRTHDPRPYLCIGHFTLNSDNGMRGLEKGLKIADVICGRPLGYSAMCRSDRH